VSVGQPFPEVDPIAVHLVGASVQVAVGVQTPLKQQGSFVEHPLIPGSIVLSLAAEQVYSVSQALEGTQ